MRGNQAQEELHKKQETTATRPCTGGELGELKEEKEDQHNLNDRENAPEFR